MDKVQCELTKYGILAAAILAWRLRLTVEVDRRWVTDQIAAGNLTYNLK